jgi:hypothetical protein
MARAYCGGADFRTGACSAKFISGDAFSPPHECLSLSFSYRNGLSASPTTIQLDMQPQTVALGLAMARQQKYMV